MSDIEICRRPDQALSGEITATATKTATQAEIIESLRAKNALLAASLTQAEEEAETLRAQLAEEVERADARAITDPCELFLLATFREAGQKDRFKLLRAALKSARKNES